MASSPFEDTSIGDQHPHLHPEVQDDLVGIICTPCVTLLKASSYSRCLCPLISRLDVPENK